MRIAILTFDRFNEIDSLVAYALLGRLADAGLEPLIAAPTPTVVSKSGLAVQAQGSLSAAGEAEAVIIGSGLKSAEIASDEALLAQLALDPARQLIASQCSGVLTLAALGLVAAGQAVTTDHVTAPAARAGGLRVVDAPFLAQGNVATAGGCLASQHIAAWIAARLAGEEAARRMLWGAAPVGGKDAYADSILAVVRPFLADRREPMRA
jgi:transcriptional regulator GlxA family with amidase domain